MIVHLPELGIVNVIVHLPEQYRSLQTETDLDVHDGLVLATAAGCEFLVIKASIIAILQESPHR